MKNPNWVRSLAWTTGALLVALALPAAALEPTSILPPNGDFELGSVGDCPPLFWSEYAAGDPLTNPGDDECTSDNRAFTGSRSVQVVDGSSSGASGIVSQSLSLGGFVSVGATVRVNADVARTVEFSIQFYDAAGSLIANTVTTATAGAGWAEVAIPLTAPPLGAVNAAMIIYSCISCSGTFYADHAEWKVI